MLFPTWTFVAFLLVVFAAPDRYASPDVVIGIHAYAAQIYCDFSGYTDMAIGVALLLGVSLLMNFDRPKRILRGWNEFHPHVVVMIERVLRHGGRREPGCALRRRQQ